MFHLSLKDRILPNHTTYVTYYLTRPLNKTCADTIPALIQFRTRILNVLFRIFAKCAKRLFECGILRRMYGSNMRSAGETNL